MTRAQKIAVGLSAALVAALLVVLVMTRKDNTSATPPGSAPASQPGSSDGGQSTPTSQPKQPATISQVVISAGVDNGGGWGTNVTLVAAAGSPPPKATIRPGASPGQYAVTFDRPVRISPAVIQSTGTSADKVLIRLTWTPSAQTLTLTATAFTSNIARTATADGSGRTVLELVRTPTPILSNDCIAVDEPAPYSKLYGITRVSGTAQLFEAGPMTIVARVPGKGQTTTKLKTSSSSRVPFSKDVNLPLLSAPSEGYIAAYDNSAKDGSEICTVKIPVYMSPGG